MAASRVPFVTNHGGPLTTSVLVVYGKAPISIEVETVMPSGVQVAWTWSVPPGTVRSPVAKRPVTGSTFMATGNPSKITAGTPTPPAATAEATDTPPKGTPAAVSAGPLSKATAPVMIMPEPGGGGT